jgi:PHD/YefM family antitoxin component YafN of YafNO toxin-antitoxin module
MGIAVPELMPISELRLRQSEVLGRLPNGPVVLTQHGHAAAVLVSPDQWNRIIAELEDLQDTNDANAARMEPTNDFDGYLARRADRVQTGD